MNIVIVVAGLYGHLSGITRHAANLARCLLTRAGVTSVHVIAADRQWGALDAALPHNDARLHLHETSIGEDPFSVNLWYYNQLPAMVRRLKADIVHFAYPAPIHRRALGCPAVVTLHDLYVYDIPSNFGFPKVLFNRFILQQSLRAADRITCVSETTSKRLSLYAPGLAGRKAVTIYNCGCHQPHTGMVWSTVSTLRRPAPPEQKHCSRFAGLSAPAAGKGDQSSGSDGRDRNRRTGDGKHSSCYPGA